MSDITLTYKGSTIATMEASGTKTLKTAGKYCEDDITLQYVRPSAPTQNDDSIYLLRALPYTSYLKRLQKIIGGTVAWNQLVPNANATFTSDNTDTRALNFYFRKDASPYTSLYNKSNVQTGILSSIVSASFDGYIQMVHAGAVRNMYYVPRQTISVQNGHKYLFSLNITGTDVSIVGGVTAKDIQIYDLTAMFGSTIADYIYALEQSNAGAGVAWFRNLFTKDYYPFDAGSIVSVKPSASKAISPDGNSYAIYPFDSTIELRGLLKLDVSNNLYYDGDEYTPDGTVARNTILRAYQNGDESLANAITDGTNTVVKTLTPTTETATPYIEHQACFPNGTEQFVDGRTVEMPVEAIAEYEVTS